MTIYIKLYIQYMYMSTYIAGACVDNMMEHLCTCELLSKLFYSLSSIIKCNLTFVIFCMVTGSPWLMAESHSIDVEFVGGIPQIGTGIIKITFRNSSKVTHKGYLCDDKSWNFKTAEVICKHTGFIGVQEAIHSAESKYGERQSNWYLYGLSCKEDMESLTDCSHQSWSEKRCVALAGVKCISDKNRHESGFYGSFFARIFMSTMFVPVCTLLCVLCRCCHRHYNERRRLNRQASRFSHHASHARTRNIELGTFPTMRASSDSLSGLPSYDQIIKDECNNFKKVSSIERTDDDETEGPPPSYETVIGTWTDKDRTSVT